MQHVSGSAGQQVLIGTKKCTCFMRVDPVKLVLQIGLCMSLFQHPWLLPSDSRLVSLLNRVFRLVRQMQTKACGESDTNHFMEMTFQLSEHVRATSFTGTTVHFQPSVFGITITLYCRDQTLGQRVHSIPVQPSTVRNEHASSATTDAGPPTAWFSLCTHCRYHHTGEC